MGILNNLRDIYKSSPSVLVSGDDSLEKSEPAQAAQALLEDPFSILDSMGHKERSSSLSYDVLRRMASKDAVISAIILTRVNQVSSFTKPSRFAKDGIGFEVRLRDLNGEPNDKDKEVMRAMEKFIENTGYSRDMSRDSFDTFIRKIVRDRLIYDQVAFEIVPDKRGNPAEIHAVDASTIRLATDKVQPDNGKKLSQGEQVKYVQVLNGAQKAFFTQEELAFAVSNPRTDVYIGGYGFSELEMLIHQVTSHLWAEEYNSRFFSQGGTTKGILNLKGSDKAPVSRHQLANFKRQWISQVSGMTGAWKTPVLSVDGLEYINVSQSNREMEFEKWLNYLINIACSVYQIDPSEINFPNRGGATGTGGGGLGDGGVKERLDFSRDKGLRPLLRFVESVINRHIISKFDDRFVFTFTGFDQETEKEQLEKKQSEARFKRTVNEIREEDGLEPIKGGDIILDPVYIQMLQQQQQAEMMAGAQQEGASEDETLESAELDMYGDPIDPDDPYNNPPAEDSDEDTEGIEDDVIEQSTTQSHDLKKSREEKYIEFEMYDD